MAISSNAERTIIWNDNYLKINWRLKDLDIKSPTISEKDTQGKTFKCLHDKGDLF